MPELSKSAAAKEAANKDLEKLMRDHAVETGKRRPGRPRKADKRLPAWLGADAEPVAQKTKGEGTGDQRQAGDPDPALPEAPAAKRRPGRPRKTALEPAAGTLTPRKGPGRKPLESGGLLADYVKRDEAGRLANEAASQAVAAVYSKLPGLIEKELRRLLK